MFLKKHKAFGSFGGLRMDYVVTEEMGHARGDIVGDFFGHVMCGVESFALNPFGPLTPEAKRVKACFDYSAFRPERQDGHVEFFALVCVIMFDVDARGSTVVFAACMNDVRIGEGT